jgi:hypothetical protein
VYGITEHIAEKHRNDDNNKYGRNCDIEHGAGKSVDTFVEPVKPLGGAIYGFNHCISLSNDMRNFRPNYY